MSSGRGDRAGPNKLLRHVRDAKVVPLSVQSAGGTCSPKNNFISEKVSKEMDDAFRDLVRFLGLS